MNYWFGLSFILILFFTSCNQEEKFNSEEWKKAGGENITIDTRSKMVKDLIQREILLNKSEPEIIEIIGYPSKLHGKEIDTIKYFAVQEFYGWNIDPIEMTFLKIIFNEKGKSTSVELYSIK